jgi:hypothetical protein
MQEHIEIFRKLNNQPQFGYKQNKLAQWSGLSESKISRFLSGSDIRAGEFFVLLKSMPEPFQRRFWENFKDERRDWRSLIATIDSAEAREILLAVAEHAFVTG